MAVAPEVETHVIEVVETVGDLVVDRHLGSARCAHARRDRRRRRDVGAGDFDRQQRRERLVAAGVAREDREDDVGHGEAERHREAQRLVRGGLRRVEGPLHRVGEGARDLQLELGHADGVGRADLDVDGVAEVEGGVGRGRDDRATVGGETLIRVVERVGRDDVLRFLRVDAAGELVLEPDWLGTGQRATNAATNVIFSGERMLGVSWEGAGFDSLEDNRMRIASANFDGSDVRVLDVPAPYTRDGNVSSFGDRVAIRSYAVNADESPVERWTELMVVDAMGTPQSDLQRIDIPYSPWARWIARDASIRFWNTTTRTPTERFGLSWSGERLEGPLLFEDERRLGESQSVEAILEEDAGFAMIWQPRDAPEFRIELRGDDGALFREGRAAPPPHPTSPDRAFLGRPELRRRGGEYHAIWTDGAVDDEANRIWAQRFGCAE